MKNLLFFEILKKLNANYRLKRKFKIFLGLGLGGILLLGCLIVWAAIATVQKVADFGTRPNVQEQVRNLGTDVTKLPALAKAGCWQKMQELMNVRVWLEKPVAENFNGLKESCLVKKQVN